jgi:hypothetical protein
LNYRFNRYQGALNIQLPPNADQQQARRNTSTMFNFSLDQALLADGSTFPFKVRSRLIPEQ